MNTSVSMVRPNLDNLPYYELPDSFYFHWYSSNDEHVWTEIQKEADKYSNITDTLFASEFGTDVQLLNSRQCYIATKENKIIGTTTAWFDDNYRGKVYGRVHWVAILPMWQSKGLSNPLLYMVCNRLSVLGHNCAYLTTSTARIPAINLYLKFGFQPEILTMADLAAWQAICDKLKYPINLPQNHLDGAQHE
jgi:GNAT superfamily N-acetyltransferase